jgi:hypothetical protein
MFSWSFFSYLMLWLEITDIEVEEVIGFLWMLANAVKGAGGYVIRLPLLENSIKANIKALTCSMLSAHIRHSCIKIQSG